MHVYLYVIDVLICGVCVCVCVCVQVISQCYTALNDAHVLLEGTLLKPNMCNAGQQFKGPKPSVQQ